MTNEYSIQRAEAFEAINSERDYQDKVWGQSESSGQEGVGGHRTVDEFASYILGYANDLHQISTHTLDPEEKLNFVRKVAGLAVACMEQHGAPKRL
jgi:hypothetical protein